MKITGGNEARGIRSGGAKRRADKTNGGGFAEHLAGPSSTPATEVASGPSSVAALLAVQAAGDAMAGRRQAYDRADGLLKRLEAMQVALLDGSLDDRALQRLAADLERQLGPIADPNLAELVAEIELRTAVELAKRGLA